MNSWTNDHEPSRTAFALGQRCKWNGNSDCMQNSSAQFNPYIIKFIFIVQYPSCLPLCLLVSLPACICRYLCLSLCALVRCKTIKTSYLLAHLKKSILICCLSICLSLFFSACVLVCLRGYLSAVYSFTGFTSITKLGMACSLGSSLTPFMLTQKLSLLAMLGYGTQVTQLSSRLE